MRRTSTHRGLGVGIVLLVTIHAGLFAGDGQEGYVAVATGGGFSIGLRTNGTLAAWGDNSQGQCETPEGKDFTAIAAGYAHGLALKADGSVLAWGNNDYGQCDVPKGSYRSIAAGWWHSTAVRTDGIVVSWGDNLDCQCDVPGPALSDQEIREVENEIDPDLANCDRINVGMVYEANGVFVKSYGRHADLNAAIALRGANPVTSTVCLSLLEQGVIHSLDDDIRLYSGKYVDCLPAQYAETPVTFRHLLEHSSGLPGVHPQLEAPAWVNGVLNLLTRPGSTYAKSDLGYAVLEDVLSDMTRKTYRRLLAEIIGAPICASSFYALSPDDPNVAGVTCTTTDLTKFLAHFLNGGYIHGELIRTEAWQEPLKDGKGMAWEVMKAPDDDFATLAFAFSAEGNSAVYMVCQPCGRLATVLVMDARADDCSGNSFQTMFDLFAILGRRHSQDRGGSHDPQWDIP